MKIISIALLGILATSVAYSQPLATQPEAIVSVPDIKWNTYDELSAEDKDLLRKGELTQPQLLAGGFLGTFIGFGSGHSVYEMYRSRGWIFTAGEVGFLSLAALGASGINNDCTEFNNGFRKCDDVSGSKGALATGLIGFVGMRIWEIIDVWTIPSSRNYEVRRIRQKMGRELTQPNWTIYPTLVLASGAKAGSTGLEFSLKF